MLLMVLCLISRRRIVVMLAGRLSWRSVLVMVHRLIGSFRSGRVVVTFMPTRCWARTRRLLGW